jgi:hypothetical protein
MAYAKIFILQLLSAAVLPLVEEVVCSVSLYFYFTGLMKLKGV